MKKLFLGYLLASILLVSCAKSTDTKLISKKHELPTIKKNDIGNTLLEAL